MQQTKNNDSKQTYNKTGLETHTYLVSVYSVDTGVALR